MEMEGLFNLVSRLGKTLVHNAIDELFDSFNQAVKNKPAEKKGTSLMDFDPETNIESEDFWENLLNQPAPKPDSRPAASSRKVIRPGLQKKNAPAVKKVKPVIPEMSEEEVNEELRVIKEMLRKKTA